MRIHISHTYSHITYPIYTLYIVYFNRYAYIIQQTPTHTHTHANKTGWLSWRGLSMRVWDVYRAKKWERDSNEGRKANDVHWYTPHIRVVTISVFGSNVTISLLVYYAILVSPLSALLKKIPYLLRFGDWVYSYISIILC